ncbi:MAG: PEP-CTERM sorting domain-containing protein, partial [Planctomycetaceae bacterium]
LRPFAHLHFHRSLSMRPRHQLSILAVTLLGALSAPMAQATVISDWWDNPIEVGDKRFKLLSYDSLLGPATVTIDQDLHLNSHKVEIGGLVHDHDIHTLEYSVEVFFGPMVIFGAKSDSDNSTPLTSSVVSGLFDSAGDMANPSLAFATLSSIDGGVGGPAYFAGRKLIFVRTTIDESSGVELGSISNSFFQSPVPEPSTWLLSAFAAGGVALVHRRRKSRPVDVNRAA